MAEHDARWVEQPDLAIGRHLAKDARRRSSGDAVQSDAVTPRLHELHTGVRSHIEAVPVDDQVVAVLLDGGLVQALLDLTLPRSDLPLARQGIDRWRLLRMGTLQPPGEHDRHGRQLPGTAALAAGTGVLTDGDEGLGDLVPDEAIDVVQGRGFHVQARKGDSVKTARGL